MKEDYLQNLLDMEKLCSDFKRSVFKRFFSYTNGSLKEKVSSHDYFYCYTLIYRKLFDIIKRIVEICDVFGIKHLERHKENLIKSVQRLENPVVIEHRKDFEYYLGKIIEIFSNAKDEIREKILLLGEI